MRAVVTRVSSASVAIGGEVHGQIGKGFLVLLGVGPADTEETARKLADKICHLRVFSDENGKMNLDLAAVGGSLLVVSSSRCMPTPNPAAPASPARPSPMWPSPCTRPSWPPAGSMGLPWSTANLAQTWK